MSFIRSIRVVRRQVANQAVFPPPRLARSITETIKEIQRHRLDPRRHRSYPRVVKRTQVGDKIIKRSRHRRVDHDGPHDWKSSRANSA